MTSLGVSTTASALEFEILYRPNTGMPRKLCSQAQFQPVAHSKCTTPRAACRGWHALMHRCSEAHPQLGFIGRPGGSSRSSCSSSFRLILHSPLRQALLPAAFPASQLLGKRLQGCCRRHQAGLDVDEREAPCTTKTGMLGEVASSYASACPPGTCPSETQSASTASSGASSPDLSNFTVCKSAPEG